MKIIYIYQKYIVFSKLIMNNKCCLKSTYVKQYVITRITNIKNIFY